MRENSGRERAGGMRKKRVRAQPRGEKERQGGGEREESAKENTTRQEGGIQRERERQLAAFSRDDAPNRARGRLGFPRGGGKTRLVSLSLITILCVVVDDEGRRRASGPGI